MTLRPQTTGGPLGRTTRTLQWLYPGAHRGHLPQVPRLVTFAFNEPDLASSTSPFASKLSVTVLRLAIHSRDHFHHHPQPSISPSNTLTIIRETLLIRWLQRTNRLTGALKGRRLSADKNSESECMPSADLGPLQLQQKRRCESRSLCSSFFS